MRLVLFSGGFDDKNVTMNKALVALVKSKSPRFTFIPSTFYGSEYDFREFVRRFRKYNISKFLHFSIDIPFDKILYEEALKSDVIFLSGGNTFYFLYQLKKHKMLNDLKTFVKRGGILAGLSAGAILMTPNINTAGFPDFDCDENTVKLKSWQGLNLVDFEFFPHYVNSKRYIEELAAYSLTCDKPLYAVPDGAGIVIDGDVIRFIGRPYCFVNGKKFRLT